MLEKIKKNIPLFLGIMGATIIGFIEGVGVDQVLVDQMMQSIKRGDHAALAGFCLVFFLLWLQLWGLKKAVLRLNETIANSFARGETRFVEIEHRLSVLENKHS